MSHKQALTEFEIDTLTYFLSTTDGFSPMNMEILDGYFVGLNCIPELVDPIECLSQVIGRDLYGSRKNHPDQITELLMRHWNLVQVELRKSLHVEHLYWPVFMARGNNKNFGNDWARGFLLGINTRPEYLEHVHHDEEICRCFVPMIRLAEEFEPESYKRNGPIPAKRRETILMLMIAGVTAIYRYFSDYTKRCKHYAALAGENFVNEQRNKPCPCGSGKQFKDCCAITIRTLH